MGDRELKTSPHSCGHRRLFLTGVSRASPEFGIARRTKGRPHTHVARAFHAGPRYSVSFRLVRLPGTSVDYNPAMRVGPLFSAPMAAILCSPAIAYPRPPVGTENIPKLMADSALVCKGEVVEAAEVTVVSDPRPPHWTATAMVHLDRCFKGERSASELVPVLVRQHPASGRWTVCGASDRRLPFVPPQARRRYERSSR